MTLPLVEPAVPSVTHRGWPVIPLWGIREGKCECGRACGRDAGKHPIGSLVPNGLKDCSSDESIVRGWREHYPNMNLGIVCGPSRLLVIDLDGVEGIDAWERLTQGHDVSTHMVSTGRGVHVYFALDEGVEVPPSVKRLDPGIDVRAGWSYVVAEGSLHACGVRYTAVALMEVALAPGWLLAALRQAHSAGNGHTNDVGEAEKVWREGERNVTMASIAGALRRRGVGESAITACLEELSATQFDPPSGDAVKVAASVARYKPAVNANGASTASAQRDGVIPSVEPHVADAVCSAPHTDEGFATVVEAMAGPGGIRWVPRLGWAVWTGDRWVLDEDGAGECAVRDWLLDAAALLRATGLDEDQRRAAALGCEKTRVPGLRRLALRSHLRAPVDVWDADPWVAGLPGGKVLELGADGVTVRAGRREDLITKTLGVDYVDGATCPGWEKFLARIMPNVELRAYLQRWAGYVLSGSVREQCMAVHYGTGANGKTTFTEAVGHVLGEYGHELMQGALLGGGDSAGDESSRAQLRGKRMACADEPEAGVPLKEAVLKRITGERKFTAKMMCRDPITFPMTAKIWVSTNYQPSIRGTDEGIWRRIRLVPFTVEIPKGERDGGLGERLRAEESAGILNWMIAGYVAWRRGGLAEPDVVRSATADYRKEEDTFGAMLEEEFIADEVGWVACADLVTIAGGWCERNHHKPMTTKDIGAQLRARGIERKQRRLIGVKVWSYPGLRAVSAVQRRSE